MLDSGARLLLVLQNWEVSALATGGGHVKGEIIDTFH